MSSIAQVSDALKRVLKERAKELERETGFVERSTARLDGPIFAHTTVFGWMDTPEASYPQLRHVAASLGVTLRSGVSSVAAGPVAGGGGRSPQQWGECARVAEPLQGSVCTGWHDHQSAAGVAGRMAWVWWQHAGSRTE